MRVRFGEPSAAELARREQLCVAARRMWQVVGEGDAARAMRLGEELDGRLRLSLERRAEGEPWAAELEVLESSAWPLAELVLAQAPPTLRASLALGRAACAFEQAVVEVERAHSVSFASAPLRAGFARGHLLEISLGIPGGAGDASQQIAAEMLVRRVLGERLFETWIGAVHVTPAPRGGVLRVLDVSRAVRELEARELYATVSAAARGVLAGLPERARVALPESNEWTLLEVEPLPGARGVAKDDLLLASTCTPELLRCFLDGGPCSSRRFSRAGECFAYLSYADAGPDLEARVARRAQVEAALSEALGGSGVVTGVGLGTLKSYVDVALTDPDTGLGRLVPALREITLPASSYLEFFDTELAEEYVSIWPHSPPRAE